MTYYTIYKHVQHVLKEHGIDVDRLVEATGLPERECIGWLHHTVLKELLPSEGLFKLAGPALLKAKEGIPVPQPIEGTNNQYRAGEWRRYYEAITAKLTETNPLWKYTEDFREKVSILTRGPDGQPLAYDFTLTYLRNFLKRPDVEGVRDLFAYIRGVVPELENVLVLGNKTNKIGIQCSPGPSPEGYDADGFPIWGDNPKNYVMLTRGTPEYERARGFAIEHLIELGYTSTDHPDVYYDEKYDVRVKLYDMMRTREYDGYMLRYSECQTSEKPAP